VLNHADVSPSNATESRGQKAGLGLALEVRDVSMAYRSGEVVLRKIDLQVKENEFVALIGASGCGKTTLLNLIAGFFSPRTGSILIDSVPVTGPGADRSMVFQDDAVFPWFSVSRNVDYPLRFKNYDDVTRKNRVKELIGLVGLQGREDAYPRELSGGMRKRVDLARALAAEPRVLLMDEPFAALDVMTKLHLQSEFLRVRDASERTVIFVTHDIEEALFLSDRIMLMGTHPGRIVREVRVPFDRPRTSELRTTAEFQTLRQDLAQAIEVTGFDA
jgi:NitT/TauT family transport system ATP-binding protein